MHKPLLASLLLCAAASAGPGGSPSCNWKSLEGTKCPMGLSEERVGSMLERCRRSGRSAAEANTLLAPIRAAEAEALPAECVFAKVEEGLAKKVSTDQVAAAAELRLDYLRRATQLVVDENRIQGPAGDHRLVVRTAMALESGLPESVLKEVLSQYNGRHYGRLLHVLEAGETLHLSGLEPPNTQRIMADFLARDLNRMEVMRAVDYLLAERKKGRDFNAIHADLWGDSE